MADVHDRTDKSQLRVHPNQKTFPSKKDTYNWAELNARMTIMLLKKTDIGIDDEYQRGDAEGNKKIVRAIASAWNWILLGVLLIAKRPDGTLWAVDGGHRLRAADHRDDVMDLPCSVFESTGPEEEAKIFYLVNNMSTNVGAYYTFRAKVKSGDQLAVQLDNMLHSHGYKASKSARDGDFSAVRALYDMGMRDLELTKKVFAFWADMAGPDKEKIPGNAIKGLFQLAVNQAHADRDIFDDAAAMKKLQSYGIGGCSASMQSKRGEIGNGGAKTCALGLLEIINKGRRKKRWSWFQA